MKRLREHTRRAQGHRPAGWCRGGLVAVGADLILTAQTDSVQAEGEGEPKGNRPPPGEGERELEGKGPIPREGEGKPKGNGPASGERSG